MPKKCILIAIASNEGPYITQFIAHHLGLGFDGIYLVVNNTVDATAEIVKKLSVVDPRVHYVDGDPLRTTTERFQKRAYQHVVKDLLPDFGSDDLYIMFLDIDEYWTPLDGSPTVQDYLEANGSPDLLVSNWFVPDADDRVFGPQLDAKMKGFTHRSVKSLWRRATEGLKMRIHFPAVGPSASFVSASDPDARLDNGRYNKFSPYPKHPGSSMVVHQMRRSAVEYAALLNYGPASGNTLFKTNRKGFQFIKRQSTEIEIQLPQQVVDVQSAIDRFIADADIAGEVASSRIMLLERCLWSIELWKKASDEVRVQSARAFSGLDLEAVETQAQDALNRLRSKSA